MVSTPIGNLEDITLRALNILREVDIIAAEDTRHSKTLFDRFGIAAKVVSYHEHNKSKMTPRLVDELKAKKRVALISDAGTPAISDPGYKLCREAIQNNIEVYPIAGVSAALAALVVSGLPTDRFVFEGFLPRKKGRQTRLHALSQEERTMIFYESPFRVYATLVDLAKHLGEAREAVVCRELTKKFEEKSRGTLLELTEQFENRKVKGEITLVVEGASYFQKKLKTDDHMNKLLL
ncbi:16S rRNA (cytidine(1402)-2'-O)-methyltransferase [bacterium]|nr:16S rRNA (cytidine(1402)-2'-O)-methyltransferase [bacterium]